MSAFFCFVSGCVRLFRRAFACQVCERGFLFCFLVRSPVGCVNAAPVGGRAVVRKRHARRAVTTTTTTQTSCARRYAYLDELRPLLQPLTDLTCEFCAQGNIERQNYTFAEPGPDNGGDCPAWNIWKYGLDKLNAYMEVTST